MTELGEHIYNIKSYHRVSVKHQQNINVWFGDCSNSTAIIHLPHPDECLNQPARCGEFPVTQIEETAQPLSIDFQSAINTFLLSFVVQSLQHKISPNTFSKLSLALEFVALIAFAGPVLGTVTFALSQGVKFANHRCRWLPQSQVETTLRALPITGLFVSSTGGSLAKNGLAIATNFASAMAGSKLADWAIPTFLKLG